LVEAVLRNSGGLLEQSSLSKHCGLSRPTVASYLDTLQITHVAFYVRPYHAGGRQELLRQPKAYGFDTGFVSHFRGWTDLREKDCGNLFEHLVLETMLAHVDPKSIHYWRDKKKREVDFVISRTRRSCDAVECKWNPDGFSVRGLKAFRNEHPKGANFVVSPQVGDAYRRQFEDLEVTFCDLKQLVDLLGA
jgi:predicted AAA+ superfamily ATPase